MNAQEVSAMEVLDDRRCSASELRRILLATPIIIVRTRGSRLKAQARFGGIIYIEPTKGRIKEVKLGEGVYLETDRSNDEYTSFTFQGRTYGVVHNN